MEPGGGGGAGSHRSPRGGRRGREGVGASLRGGGREALYIEDVARIVERLSGTARSGDLILIRARGGFGGIQGNLARALETRSIVPPVPGKTP